MFLKKVRDNLSHKYISRNLVYQYKYTGTKNDNLTLEYPCFVSEINTETIDKYFSENKILKKSFLQFLQQGFKGFFIGNQDQQWIAYGWISNPDNFGPIHLPNQIKKKNVFWIFYCSTHIDFRGQGFYKKILAFLIEKSFKNDSQSQIYIDTQDNNIAAIKAILSVGFEPQGIIKTYRIGIPKIKSWYIGDWNQEQKHPKVVSLN